MQLTFTIIQPNGQDTKLYTAESEIVVFGRSDQSDVILENDYVSGTHAQIQYAGNSFFIQDLKSTNGTTVNGQSVQGLTRIDENSIVEFGVGGPKVRILSMDSAPAGKSTYDRTAVQSGQGTPERFQPESHPPNAPGWSGMTTAGAFLRQTEVIVIAVVVCLAGFAFFMSRESTASRDMLPSSTNIATGDTDTTKYGGQSTASAANTTPSPARLGDSNGPSNPGAPEKRVQSSDPAAIARIIQNRVVWIGLKFRIGEKDQTFPVASGWCLSNREIITTGTAIVELEKGEKEGTVVVYSGLLPASNRFVEVSRLRRHPVFEREPFGTSLSTENNLGLIELSNPISFSAEQRDAVASFPEWTEWYKSRDARGMMRCGYQIHSPGEPLSAVNVPEFSWSKMTVTQANPGSDGLEQLPVIRVALDKAAPSFSGHVVVDFSGKLLGTLERVDNQNGFLIPIDRLSDF